MREKYEDMKERHRELRENAVERDYQTMQKLKESYPGNEEMLKQHKNKHAFYAAQEIRGEKIEYFKNKAGDALLRCNIL